MRLWTLGIEPNTFWQGGEPPYHSTILPFKRQQTQLLEVMVRAVIRALVYRPAYAKKYDQTAKLARLSRAYDSNCTACVSLDLFPTFTSIALAITVMSVSGVKKKKKESVFHIYGLSRLWSYAVLFGSC